MKHLEKRLCVYIPIDIDRGIDVVISISMVRHMT